jgi:hypothetical protein
MSDVVDRIEGSTHQVEDGPLGARVRAIADHEAGGKGWIVYLVRRNGFVHRAESPTTAETVRPCEEKQAFARLLCVRLNTEVACEGAWLVILAGDDRIVCAWKAPDGSVPLMCEDDEPWARQRLVPIETFLTNAEVAIRKYAYSIMQDLGLYVGDRPQSFLV